MLRELELRDRVVAICHRLYQRGLIAAADGNVSVRLGPKEVLVTPSGFHKGFITAADLIVTDLAGHRLRGKHKPSSEFLMHALCYAERPDISAVVHAHPPITVGLALAGVSLAQCILSETCLVLGPILTAPYTTPTTEEVPRVLRPYVRQANAVVMDRHGALTLGRDLEEAYNRMEAMEHAARITHAARTLGPITPLPPLEVQKLQALAASLGIPRAPDPCTLCNACPNGTGGPGRAAEPTSGAVLGHRGADR
ncbi:MAG: class II aldolase/adducin family protein [Myxococcales bacterium]|nr:class II aldolase/adducin family protein [Myxococcota bacterium]MDW8282617.1 class II aldolase/adducin family protein [Myxococcales bacterium]